MAKPAKARGSAAVGSLVGISSAFPKDMHDAAHQVRLLREAVQSAKVRIGFFLGAGCPSGIYDEKNEKSIRHIPDVAGLTLSVRESLLSADKEATLSLTPIWDKLIESCKCSIETIPNVEHVLTEIRTLCARRGNSDVDGVSKENLKILDRKICDAITKEVGKSLPSHRCAYHRFASWISGIHRIAPVEIFTPNYDLLIEEALETQGVPHFDGFVGAREPFFDIASIEQDSIPPRWTRLWKLHGSINWQKRDDGTVFRVAGKAADGKMMIYPSHLKYDQSRRMPYLAMLDRLKAFFRAGGQSPGFGPPVLVVSGYSFSDDHLNEVLTDGLRGNRSAQCFVLAYDSLSKSKPIVEMAIKQPNLSLIASDGAVVGTRPGLYRHASSGMSTEPWVSVEAAVPEVDATPANLTRSRLGDFHYLCLLLEHLCGTKPDDDSIPSP